MPLAVRMGAGHHPEGFRRVEHLATHIAAQALAVDAAMAADGSSSERPLSERWLVPISLLQGQQDRYRHLRPLSLEMARTLGADPELAATLKDWDSTNIPRMGNASDQNFSMRWRCLARATELAARFNVFLGPGASRVAAL